MMMGGIGGFGLRARDFSLFHDYDGYVVIHPHRAGYLTLFAEMTTLPRQPAARDGSWEMRSGRNSRVLSRNRVW